MFYSQPLATRFGTELIGHLTADHWTSVDIAVAWVRGSGILHLDAALRTFLRAGNSIRVVVGVDLDNTSREGLEALLSLEGDGAINTFIHHNEAGTVFHPKLYLFRNSKDAKLIVGSNNLTEGGLYRNTEAGLEIDASSGGSLIVSALNAIDAWCDSSIGLAHKLDAAFLTELVSHGYVKDEQTLRTAAAARRSALGAKAGAKKKLFGSLVVTPPQKPAKASITKSKSAAAPAGKVVLTAKKTSATGQVLLMRVRKARGTQVQIPLAVIRTPFFSGATQVYSVATAVNRGIHATHAARAGAGANPNTLKLEMPETGPMADPVVRFERTAAGDIQYEVYDSTSAKGRTIMQALQRGQVGINPSTRLTVPSSPATSTWWRFI